MRASYNWGMTSGWRSQGAKSMMWQGRGMHLAQDNSERPQILKGFFFFFYPLDQDFTTLMLLTSGAG